MSKSRKDYGVIRTPTGGEAIVRNRHVSDMIQDQQAHIAHLREQIEKSTGALKLSTLRLAQFDSHWWTRLGRACRVGLPR